MSLPIRRENHGIPCRNPTHISESVAPRPLLWTNGIKWCSTQDSNLYLMDSGSISSAKLGYWSICVIRGIPYDDLAASAGLEPATLALTGRCSGLLELRSHMVSRAGLEPARFSVVGLRPTAIAAMPPADKWSGWRDSNSRPSGPRPDALRKLSYAPKIGAPDRSRTCTERILIPIPLPELGYWSIFIEYLLMPFILPFRMPLDHR